MIFAEIMAKSNHFGNKILHTHVCFNAKGLEGLEKI